MAGSLRKTVSTGDPTGKRVHTICRWLWCEIMLAFLTLPRREVLSCYKDVTSINFASALCPLFHARKYFVHVLHSVDNIQNMY